MKRLHSWCVANRGGLWWAIMGPCFVIAAIALIPPPILAGALVAIMFAAWPLYFFSFVKSSLFKKHRTGCGE